MEQAESKNGTGDPAMPRRPPDWCKSCPYPSHGFVCRSNGAECMRSRIRQIQAKESNVTC